jgi:molybdate transport repressor ModE-like protein
LDWDHLRFFGELARSGSMAAAARRMGVEHTTVSRRIQALEKQLGAVLFAREGGQWRLTEAGRQLQEVTNTMQSAVDGLERGPLAHAAAAEGPAGLVRVGATEGFGTQMLASEQPEVMDILGRQFEAALIKIALKHTHGRKNDAAVRLGIGRNTITRKIQELGIGGAEDD